jgi:hypothetical protein
MRQTYKLAKENPQTIFVSLSPGWVKTGKEVEHIYFIR